MSSWGLPKIWSVLLLCVVATNTVYAGDGLSSTILGYRWGEEQDDAALIRNAEKTSEGYRLTQADILDAVNHDIRKGWSKGSGSGIYYSSDPVDSFGDGRSELFIFELTSPHDGWFPIAVGPLGSQVRDFYLSGGTPPPMVSRYTETWHVIARVPSDQDFAEGLKITFHAATVDDAKMVLQDLNKQWSTSSTAVENMDRVLKRFKLRTTDASYKIPVDTLRFMKKFADIAPDIIPAAFDGHSPMAEELQTLRTELVKLLDQKIQRDCLHDALLLAPK
jgi:hypothetical protein